MTLDAGQAAPDFDLPTDGGGRVRLADFEGRPLVLYFYPRDDTPGAPRRPRVLPRPIPSSRPPAFRFWDLQGQHREPRPVQGQI